MEKCLYNLFCVNELRKNKKDIPIGDALILV